MDKTPDSSSTRRSQKRPHSPQDESNPPVDAKVPTTEGGGLLDSDAKRDKLLRLLGGKKRKNETAASKWLERVRSREDELKVSTDLESQFNESLTHKLTGASRRHIGIGFHEDPAPTQPSNTSENVDKSTNAGTAKLDSNQTPPITVPTQGTTKNSEQKSIIETLSGRANVPGISRPHLNMPSPSYGYPTPPYGYGMGPGMVPPAMYGYPGPYVGAAGRPPGYMVPPPKYGPPTTLPNFTAPPDPSKGQWYPAPHPVRPRTEKPAEQSDSGPKSKNSFYAQFKKAS